MDWKKIKALAYKKRMSCKQVFKLVDDFPSALPSVSGLEKAIQKCGEIMERYHGKDMDKYGIAEEIWKILEGTGRKG